MKAALLVILVLVGVVSCARKESDYLAEWKKFTSKYEKNYAHDEAYYRYTIFKQTVDYIDHFNKNLAKDRSFSVGINAFSDLTKEEFSKYYLGTKVDATKHVKTGQKFVPKIDLGAVPTTWNWTSQGAVTPSRTKDNVDLAGLSPQLDLLKDATSSTPSP